MQLKKTKASANTVRVFIVDDHPLIRRGLRELLEGEPNLQVCGEAANPQEALRQLALLDPHLAIIDISLDRGNGLELVQEIKVRYASMKTLVVSMHDETLFAERALRAGAMGYISKQEATDKVLDAIRDVLRGKVYLSPRMAEQILERAVSPNGHKQEGLGGLSNRELAVFEMIGKGFTTRQIADRFHLSVKTIETYREKIKAKLRIKNSPQLIRSATQWVLEGHLDPNLDPGLSH